VYTAKARPNKHPRRVPAMSVYDGRQCCGFVDESSDAEFHAYDLTGKKLGAFTTLRDAVRAIPKAPGHE
jgi:hypothetical protein